MNDLPINTVKPSPADQPLRVTVLGGGSFGTAMANLAARNGCQTRMWIRDATVAAQMQNTRRNQRYLPDFELHESLRYSGDLAEVVQDCDVLLVAVPSHSFRAVLRQVGVLLTGSSAQLCLDE